MAVLTTVKSTGTTLVESDPVEQVAADVNYGKLRILYDTYAVPAADNFGTSGLIRLFKIPKGARLVDFEASMPASGATGIFDVGWAASAELIKGTATPVEAASANGILAIVDPGAAVVNRQKMVATSAGFMKKFAAEVEVQADCTEATTVVGAVTYHFTAIIIVE